MVVDTKKENLCINQIVGQREKTVDVEGDIIIPDIKPDILNAINTSGNVCVYKKDILDGKIRMDGSINIYVMYLPDGESGAVRGLNTSLDFTEVIDIDEARSNMSSYENVNVKSIECRVLNGRKINLKVTLEIKVQVYSNDDISLIKEIQNDNNMQILSKTTQINSLLGEGSNKIYAKDKLSIDEIDNLAEILKADFNIVNKETKISYNKVLAKADLDVKIMYLTEDNRICKVNGQIPVMGFVDIPNVTDDNICDTRYTIKNIIIKPNSVEEHGIYVEVQIELECSVYETKEINVIQDLYSPKDSVEFAKKKINAMTDKKEQKGVCSIDEQIQIPDIGDSRIYDVDICPRILSQNYVNDKIVYEGEVELKFLYEAENIARIDARFAKFNFNYTMESNGLTPNNRIETNIQIKQSDFITQGNGNINCKIELELDTSISNTRQINVIDEVNIGDEIPYTSYSMVIYFVKKQDTLWNIAKKFNSTISCIMKANNIEDEKQIHQGMQLFIPKYNCKKLA